jgi:hypothetical protein
MPVTKIGSRWNKTGAEGQLDFYRKDLGTSVFTITEEGAIFPNPYGAQDYFVDLNVSSSGDGLSWATAFGTVAEAITASNTSIGLSANRWWARRNRIFVCGDGIDEDLTVLPEKCDIIGVGSDLFPFPRIVGNHAFAAAAVGVRFINLGFYTSATGDLMSFPTSCHGLQILNCFMHPGTTSAKAIEITSSAHVRIDGNTITVGAGDMSKIFGVGISIEGTTCHDTHITNNNITATAGIAIVEAGAAAMGSIIQGNVIRATGLAIDDNSDDFQVVNNRWMTDIDTSTSTAGYDFNIQLAAGNIQMGATGLCDSIPFMKIAE